MTYTPIPQGATDWDVPLNAALADQDARIDANAGNLTALDLAKVSKSGDTLTGNYILNGDLSQTGNYALSGNINAAAITTTGTSQIQNLRMGPTANFGGGSGGVITMSSANTVPNANTSGSILYSDAGFFKVRNTNGKIFDSSVDVQNFSRITADASVTNTTTYTPTGLSVPVVANAVYMLDGYMSHNTLAAAGSAWRFTGPSGTTGHWTVFSLSGTINADFGTIRTSVSSNGVGTTRTAGANSGDLGLFVKGTVITAGTAGNFVLDFAQQTPNAQSTIIRANSWLRLDRIG